MGGESKSTQTQNSTTAPWQAAQPSLQGILDKLGPMIGGSGITGAESGALNTLEGNAGQAGQFAPQLKQFAADLFGGGGATDQAGNVNANYQRFVDQTNPLASNTNYDPRNTPGFSDALNTTISDITNGTNGQFAAAGRDFSGANSMALGRGIMQGVAPTIAAQYNQNVQNQQGAAGNLFAGGNTAAGLQTGMTQQALANRGQGVTAAGAANEAANAPSNAILEAEARRRGIPVQALGLLAQIGIPIAGLGSQSTGQSQGTQQMSGADQFMKIGQGAAGFGKLLFG